MSRIEEIRNFLTDYYSDTSLSGRFQFGVMTGDITIISVDNYYLMMAYKSEDIGLTKLSFKITKEYSLTKFSSEYFISDMSTHNGYVISNNDDAIEYIYDRLKDIIRDFKIKRVLD